MSPHGALHELWKHLASCFAAEAVNFAAPGSYSSHRTVSRGLQGHFSERCYGCRDLKQVLCVWMEEETDCFLQVIKEKNIYILKNKTVLIANIEMPINAKVFRTVIL